MRSAKKIKLPLSTQTNIGISPVKFFEIEQPISLILFQFELC